MDLQADDGLELGHARTFEPSNPIACSSACAASRIRFSLNAGPAIWKAVGRPSASPLGIEMAGIPGISIPGGLADGLPVGVQLAGPAFSENRILDAAYALEQAIGFDGSGAFA